MMPGLRTGSRSLTVACLPVQNGLPGITFVSTSRGCSVGPQERAQFYHFAITDGWMSRNEARAFEDMNPVDGLDEMLVSVNAANPLNNFKDTKGKEEKNDE
nr:hypothetical protein [Escherichia coli]